MEVAPSSDFFGVGPGQSLGKLLSAAVRAQKKNRRGGKQTDVKIGDRFLDINGFLKENDVQKNDSFATVATTFLQLEKCC